MRSLKIRKEFVFIIPFIVALTVRGAALWFRSDSPFPFYNYIVGLDMNTLLHIGSWLYNGFSLFTLYKFTIAATMYFNGGQPMPEAIVVIQMLMGIGITLLVTWCALALTGKKSWALASGLLAALYAPGLMYESFILKETYMTFFSLLALAGLIWARKKHFSPSASYTVGLLLALPCMCRVSASIFCVLGAAWVLWCYFNRFGGLQDKRWRIKMSIVTACLAGGIATLLVPVSIFNYYNTGKSELRPFHINMKYAVSVGKANNAQSMSVEPSEFPYESPKLGTDTNVIGTVTSANFLLGFAKKVPLVFSSTEIPNNLNYYYLKDLLFPLKYMIGPMFLIPLALISLILLLITGGVFRKNSILMIFIISFIIPICLFYPLARYRIIFYPVFCMLAPLPCFFILNNLQRNKLKIFILLTIAAGVIVLMPVSPKEKVRPVDLITYGKAVELKELSPGKSLSLYQDAWQMAPQSKTAIACYISAILKSGRPVQAARIIMPNLQKNPNNSAYLYYGALTILFCQQTEETEKIFKALNHENPGSFRKHYFNYWGQSTTPLPTTIGTLALEPARAN